jgi:hypothetical protein
VFLAALLAAGIRFYHLTNASFWIDELNTVHVCGDLAGTHRTKVLGYVPTAVGLVLAGADLSAIDHETSNTWREMGINEWSARWPSALIGVLSVPILALASRRILGDRASAMFAFLMAVAPWHIYWSQAARFYTLQFLFYSLALIWYFRATNEGSAWRMVGALAMVFLALISQPTALIIGAVFAADWIIALLRKEPVRLGKSGWIGALVMLGLFGVVLLGDMRSAPSDWTQFADQHRQSPARMILGTAYLVGPPVALLALLTGSWLLRQRPRLSIYLFAGALLPLLVFAIVSTYSYVGLRYTFISLYCWLALTAIGVEQLYLAIRPRLGHALGLAPLAMILVFMLLMDYQYDNSGKGFHTRWREAFAYVATRRQPGELVFSDTHPMIGRYYLQDPSVESIPKSTEGVRALDRRSWLVIEAEDSIRGPMKTWIGEAAEFKAYFDVRGVHPQSSVRVYLYEPNADPAGDAGRGSGTSPESQ